MEKQLEDNIYGSTQGDLWGVEITVIRLPIAWEGCMR